MNALNDSKKTWLISFLICLTFVACKKNNNDDSTATDPVNLDSTGFTYLLEQSIDGLPLWTTPCTHKVRTNERPPMETRSGLHLSAAKREFEPVQLIIGPASGSVEVSVDPFPNLGSDQRVELARVGFEGEWSEHLTPVLAGESISLGSDSPQPIWLTVYVPADADAGEHTTSIQVKSGSSTIHIPVTLTVFDFTLPSKINFASQLNLSLSDLMGSGDVDSVKTMLFEHRFTPKSVTWPSGFNWDITWDSSHSPDRCEVFYDEPHESDPYSIGALAKRYILGENWNGVGFPNSMIFQFVNNSTPRPDEFCGISRGDHYGSAEYNTEWSQFLSALQEYLTDNGLIEKAYYYVQNEPQNDEDHNLAAHLCRLTKAAAPNLRIAVSEEPKPEIAETAEGGGCGFDIWIAHIRAYQQNYAWQRQRDHDETVWYYSLDHDPDPYFNPTMVEKPGIHQRIIPWVSWHDRVTGWAYYDANRFFDGSSPTIRAELLREGFEDYEYLYLANNSNHPKVFEDNQVDATVNSVASGLTSWTKNPDALMALRHELGLFLEGSRDSLPVIESDSNSRKRDSYFINFQDPDGEPAADPLIIDGNTYMKIGWTAYNDEDVYGWYGEYLGTDIVAYGYDSTEGYNEAQRSFLYDDYGRDNLFEFALENGRYEVTIGVGRPAHGYPGDPHNASIEGIKVVDDAITTNEAPLIEETTTIDLIDGSLSIEIGGRSQSSGNWAYTFAAYLKILPVD